MFYLLSQVGWNGPSTTLLSCSYADSQLVHYLIQKKFLPILSRYRSSLPLDCPFHSMRDIFGWPKHDINLAAKGGMSQEDKDIWYCPLCGHRFRCDQNQHPLHKDSYYVASNGADDGVCLATFCDIMRCEVISYRLNKQSLGYREGKEEAKSLAPVGGTTPPPFQSKGPCNQEKMKRLMDRCQAIIRQCTVGLLVNLSVKDFREIEDEMNKAICSYLTCERFWDDNINEVRRVPFLFCLVLGLMVITGFCLCYYVVWVLFGSLPQEDLLPPEGKGDSPVDLWFNDINANNFPLNDYPPWPEQKLNGERINRY